MKKGVFIPGLLLAGALALVGCASHKHDYKFAEEAQAARVPDFLSGPASVLLSSPNGISARLTVEMPGSTNKNHTISGQLLVQGSHILFAPKTGDRAFIWDAQARTGYMLSDALQGYAPISSPAHITNIVTTAEVAGPRETQVNGRSAHEADMSVASDDGTTATFVLWRANDLNGFPVQIRSVNSVPPFILNLSEIRSEKLTDKIFQPPDGFTPYSSAEAMAGELYARKAKVKSANSHDDYQPLEPATGTHYSK